MPSHGDILNKIEAHEKTDHGIVFLVPRNEKTLIIGGIARKNEWDLNLRVDPPAIQRIKRCEAFFPGLEHATVDADYPIAQGLRPARMGNVRVERELRMTTSTAKSFSRIVHSYGHGGSGWSLAFGCAVDVCGLVEEILKGVAPETMGKRWKGRHNMLGSSIEIIDERRQHEKLRKVHDSSDMPRVMSRL